MPTTYLFEPPAPASLSIAGDRRRFPVGRIYCVGRNYAAHAREMGMDMRDPPFFFSKPGTAVLDGAAGEVTMAYPPATSNLHHEVELVVALHRGGYRLSQDEALAAVFGYAVGLDMTRRDLQLQARDQGRPWDLSKGFLQSAPLGALCPAAQCGHLRQGEIRLDLNGQTRQRSDLDQMIWSVAESLSLLSQLEPLRAGDLLMTGTPEGVGTARPGDRLEASIAGLPGLCVRVGPAVQS